MTVALPRRLSSFAASAEGGAAEDLRREVRAQPAAQCFWQLLSCMALRLRVRQH